MHQHKQSIFKFCSIILINCALFFNFLAFSSFYRSLGSNLVSHSPVSKGIKVKRIRTSYLEDAEIWTKADEQNLTHRDLSKPTRKHSEFLADCRLTNCFNFDKCKPGERLKIHIYPDSSKISSSSISSTYQKIIQIIESSIYYEPDESKACLFITRYDYLDRDPLSRDCQKNLPASLPLDYGKNHIVFNLYSGTWPDYRELDLYGFNLGYSILAKASFSYQNYRPGFDISIPLFSKNHSTRGKTLMEPEDGPEYQLVDDVVIETIDTTRLDSSDRKNLLVFKGKRYTHGIGSETRNTLHHLHNDRDILIYTTCKHGKKWKDLKDERCAKDNLEYEKSNYSILMANSTFCLVPRGRRLGSFRFLEALANGCIPVLLSNNWVKPFEDVIDWSEIVVEGDERSLLQLPEIIRSYEWKKIQQMAAKSLAVYETYFSSVERIVYTTIDILNERIQTHLSFTTFLWNLVNPSFTSFTGAIWYDAEYSFDLKDYPGYGKLSDSYSPSRSSPLSSSSATSNSISLPRIQGPINGYTTVLHINKPIMPSTIHRLIKSLSKSQYLVKIIIIWALPGDPPSILMKNPFYDSFLVSVVIPESKSINAKLFPYKDINTYAVLSLQPDTTITVEELDFAYLVWLSFPHRIIGFTARDHYYDEDRYRWYYTSKWTNYYSIILLDAAFYHRYYNNLYTNYISNNKFFAQNFNNWDDELCLDLIFNFLISHLTREGPIKVTQRKRTSNSSSSLYNLNPLNSQECFTFLYNISFNYVPLIKSQMRFDPVLFKDPVSNFRKKYRKLEAVS